MDFKRLLRRQSELYKSEDAKYARAKRDLDNLATKHLNSDITSKECQELRIGIKNRARNHKHKLEENWRSYR